MTSPQNLLRKIRVSWGDFLSIFEPDPDRRTYEQEYKQDLNRQVMTLQYPGSILGIFVWLGFALGTDQKLHPEFPELVYFRIGLSLISMISLALFLLGSITKIPIRKFGLEFAYVFASYFLLSCSFFTGRIADDPNYVSGLQIAVLIIVFLPIPRRVSFLLYGASISVFILAVILYSPPLNTPQAAYSMQNLGIAYSVAIVFSIIVEKYRFATFVGNFKIVEKNREISEKMDQIQILKERQDGDYFLTSLLLTPLLKKEITAESPLTVEFLFDQYKKFSFRGKEYEIGGDYTSAYEILLRGKKYTAFINGDAMGKSVQGAGGALVLGSVFNSIISRSRLSPEIQARSPERWLKEGFLDLQNVFETFDGFMLVSAVMGLVDLGTGTLYFVNAEHPWPVLYRDGKASFLGTDSNIRKLGISEILNSKIAVQTFKLRPNDIVFCGSDGKDDLILEENFSGKRTINEDETQFLHCVEESQGDLEKIRRSLLTKGKLSDDLSLLSLAYRPSQDPYNSDESSVLVKAEAAFKSRNYSDAIHILEESLPKDSGIWQELSPKIAKALSRLYDKLGRIREAAIWAETALDWDPADSEFFFQTSLLWKKVYAASRDDEALERASEYGERFRVRTPAHVRNLINLSDTYRLLGNRVRASKLLAEASELLPDDPKIRNLRQLLEQRKP
ncbi:SpoIIE-like protein phosphatase domain protein [Leptospira inadai serovar Lyme str. 10]|uniref:SpoIIE-like protein phosphatase domain protein n=2 Tax=Leptospira inadai serovar Lyme TaxID=293084 RepID=V6HA33_9LEPT|nr:PP2C family protein-serine/threonine phosphatase [Leptospira inadai]EQA36181.1 SpoIIE-like protein phosphatase domain protein [Leptospira inadai serovar Lyme str. 10]PNV74829.1 stage II sporulation protein E [Leptospira inadai serovar Lyme]